MSDSLGSENFSGSDSTSAARHSFGNPKPITVPSFENARNTIRPTRNFTRPRTNASYARGRVAANSHTSSIVTGTASAKDGAQPLEALRRPQLLRVVVLLERRCAVRERDPPDLRPRVDVNVRCDRPRIVERAAPNEEDGGSTVFAVDRDPALGTAVDALLAPVVARNVGRVRLAREQL